MDHMKARTLFLATVVGSVFLAQATGGVKDLNTKRAFPEIASKAEWQKRAQEIREHVLVSCGLWPMPEKTPLNARIFGRVERDGYSVEKVYFESYPGFYAAGNLYRPLGKGGGPFPGVLNPHGHWSNGRMADEDSGSIAARCISFARQGMVAFSWDMAGYNDSLQLNHQRFGASPTNQLWNISLMGLQTWNSIRALDFLEGLPDVDKKRLACTGESGGGTQTFMLGAVDSRLAAQAPIVMVSHSMQGGCLCENAPGLRVDYSNMEIAAVPAPRPQKLVAATGDWTRATMTVEGPALQKIYDLFGGRDRLSYEIFNYNHNYNKTSREAVYRWFGKWLLHENDPEKLKEQPYTKEPDSDLRVFPDRKLPEGALSEDEFGASLVRMAQARLDGSEPRDKKTLAAWKREYLPAWEHDLELQHVQGESAIEETKDGETTVRIKRQPDGYEMNFNVLAASSGNSKAAVIISSVGNEDQEGARKLAQKLRDEGVITLRISHDGVPEGRNQFANYFSTYNRTVLQDRVAELKVAAQYAQQKLKAGKVFVIGRGSAGLAAFAAAPLVSGVAADCNGLDDSKDENLLDVNVFFPGVRGIGSFQGIASLAAPNPLLIHNTAGKLNVNWLPGIYEREKTQYRQMQERASDQALAEWALALSKR
jgi:dienelactone hydrolase